MPGAWPVSHLLQQVRYLLFFASLASSFVQKDLNQLEKIGEHQAILLSIPGCIFT